MVVIQRIETFKNLLELIRTSQNRNNITYYKSKWQNLFHSRELPLHIQYKNIKHISASNKN